MSKGRKAAQAAVGQKRQEAAHSAVGQTRLRAAVVAVGLTLSKATQNCGGDGGCNKSGR
jgi:hypothetical protein